MKAEKNRQGTSLTVKQEEQIDMSVAYEPWKKSDVERYFNKAENNISEKQIAAIKKILGNGIPKDIYVDMPPANN